MDLTAEQQLYWSDYLAQAPDSPPGTDQSVIAAQPGSPDITDQLIDLYLQGKKTAGSGLVEDYLTAGDPLPQVGDHWIALDSHGTPQCILRTLRVETHKFLEVPEYIAVAEGEGDLSLEYWRTVHAQHFAADLHAWGLERIEDAPSSPSSSSWSTRPGWNTHGSPGVEAVSEFPT